MSDDTGETGESKFTPGPWTAAFLKHQDNVAVRTERGELVCESYLWHRLDNDIGRMKADAQLIASAPTMHAELAHLRTVNAELVAACEKNVRLVNELRCFVSSPIIQADLKQVEDSLRAAIAKATGEGGGA